MLSNICQTFIFYIHFFNRKLKLNNFWMFNTNISGFGLFLKKNTPYLNGNNCLFGTLDSNWDNFNSMCYVDYLLISMCAPLFLSFFLFFSPFRVSRLYTFFPIQKNANFVQKNIILLYPIIILAFYNFAFAFDTEVVIYEM